MHLGSRAVAAEWISGSGNRSHAAQVVGARHFRVRVRTDAARVRLSRLGAEQLRRQVGRPWSSATPCLTEIWRRSRATICHPEGPRSATVHDRGTREYEPHISQGTVVYAGGLRKILRQAEKEATSFCGMAATTTLLFMSPIWKSCGRSAPARHELSYFPGEVNLRRADAIVINKVDTAEQRDIETVRQNIKLHNPRQWFLRWPAESPFPNRVW